jgi:hypothetical protein
MFDERVTKIWMWRWIGCVVNYLMAVMMPLENELLKNSSIIENGLPEQLMRTCRLGF